MLQRHLLYTGVTRGKRLVVLMGQKKAIAIAVRNVSGRRRWSKLDEWLRLGAAREFAHALEVGLMHRRAQPTVDQLERGREARRPHFVQDVGYLMRRGKIIVGFGRTNNSF